MANCQSPQFCSQIPPRGGHVGRLVHRFLPSIRALGVVDWREWAPQLGRAPERAPADARQSLNRRRAKSPHTAPVERPRRCSTTRHTFNLSTVIGESAAIAAQGHDSGLHTGSSNVLRLMAASVVRSHEIAAPCDGLLVQGPCLCSRLRWGPPPGFAFPVALLP
jgi:hypothetical protein